MVQHEISNEELVSLIKRGLIYEDRGKVFKWHGGFRRYHPLQTQFHPLSGRARYVIHIGSRQRTIFANRLLWMIRYGREIPESHDVDHIDNDRRNDCGNNLQTLPLSENRREGYELQMEKNLQSWTDFFDFIEFMGRPPVEGHPLWN